MAGEPWYLEGNGGTDPDSDFIGTTDAKPLVFRVFGSECMRISNSVDAPVLLVTKPVGARSAGTATIRLQVTRPALDIGGFSRRVGGWDISYVEGGQRLEFQQTEAAERALAIEPDGSLTVRILEIIGGGDVAERLQTDGDLEPGTVVCLDPEHPGKVTESTLAYDRLVAGVVTGGATQSSGLVLSADADGQPVALGGTVVCQAEAPIRAGDLLTTSDRAGHAMKAEDSARTQGAVLGKAMSSLVSGTGSVLVLVALA